MIGCPNTQNKARKGVLRQRQGGARRERSQKQIFFRGRGQTLKPPQSRPTTARQEAPQEPPPKKNNSVGNRGAPTKMGRGEFADSLFPRQLSAAGFRAGHAAAPRRMRPTLAFPRPSPTRAPRVPSPPPQKKAGTQNRAPRRFGGEGVASEATRAPPGSVAPTIPFD